MIPSRTRRALYAIVLVLPFCRLPAQAPVVAPVATRHEGTFAGTRVAYTATVEETIVPGPTGTPMARLVSTAYTADASDPATRPVLFICNGGPIAPSWPLHMLALGPRRLAIPADLTADSSRFHLVDNGYTVLDVSDLVFYDPASTGWSRVLDGVDPAAYYTAESDAQQMAAFVEAWLHAHGRERSPVYLLGESYATIRVPEAARILSQRPTPILVDGVFIMGQAVNQLEINTRPYNILAYVAGLPTVAATAWYHRTVDRRALTVAQFMEEAFRFGETEYLPALFRGHTLAEPQRKRIAQRLQQFTGIPATWYLAHDLRMPRTTYLREAFKDKGLRLGWDDARYIGPVKGPDPDGAPSLAAYGALLRYFREELGVTRTEPYEQHQPYPAPPQAPGWAYGPDASPFADFPYAASLTGMFARNPRFRLVVGSGIYDHKTTTGAARYLVTQAGWPRDRVRLVTYEGGHMAYTNEEALAAFTADVRALVAPQRPR